MDHRLPMEAGTDRFLACVRSGDGPGLEDLLAEHRDGCLAHARRILGNGSDADDAVQEAFMRLLRDVDAYDGSASFIAVLHRLVVEASLDLRRKATRRLRREAPMVARIETPAAIPEAPEEHAKRLRALVDELPEEFRAAIELRFFAGLSMKEVAERLGVSENLVAVRVHRGKERLRRRLEQAGILVALGALESQLAAAAPTGTAAKTAAGGAASLSPAWWSAMVLLLLAALSAWPLWRMLRAPAVAPPAPTATATTTSRAPSAAAGARQAYTWNFDDGPPSDIRLINGHWHHLDHGGVGGGGCMETTFDGALLVIDRPRLEGPLELSVEQSPWRLHAGNCRVLFGWWGSGHRCELENAGMPADPFDNHHDRDNEVFHRVWSYLGEDALDEWDERGRTGLSFFGSPPDRPPLTLLVLGSQRLDDLRIEQVDPAEVPDVSVYRRAVLAVPETARQGRTALAGVTGPDPARPVRVYWRR